MPAKTKLKVGDIFTNNEGCVCSIISYQNCKDITIRFHDSFSWVTSVRSSSLSLGSFKNVYFQSVYNTGYLGFGKHVVRRDGAVTREYRVWLLMMARCYSDRQKNLKYNPYKDCSVCEDWHNFQVFAEWYTSHEFYGLKYELDKDIKVKGNRVYSAETCCLVPAYINLLVHVKQEKSSKLPTGVVRRASGRYCAYLTKNKKQHSLGTFDTVREASSEYVRKKELHVKDEAHVWKDFISEGIFEALLKWTVY